MIELRGTAAIREGLKYCSGNEITQHHSQTDSPTESLAH